MPFSWDSLADGQLPNAKGTLYTSGSRTSIMSIVLVETSGAAHAVNIYIKRVSGTSRRLIPANIVMDSSVATAPAKIECLDHPLELSPGDVIEGDADAAAVIDYAITGAQM